MGDEANQVKWVGIRSTNPESNIPIKPSSTHNIHAVQPGKWDATYQGVARTQIIMANQAIAGTVIIYTVPAGKKLYITTAYAAFSHTAADYALLATRNAADVYVYTIIQLSIVVAGNLGISHSFPMPLIVEPLYDVWFSVTNGNGFGGITGWIE